jgi:hypothetical protein
MNEQISLLDLTTLTFETYLHKHDVFLASSSPEHQKDVDCFKCRILKKRRCHYTWKVALFPGECYRQSHPDRTNLRILVFADNKDLQCGVLYESLTSVPLIDGTQLEMKIKPPLPTHFSSNVCIWCKTAIIDPNLKSLNFESFLFTAQHAKIMQSPIL